MASTKWVLDPTHSELGFKIKHLMITNVSGSFTDFAVEAETVGNDFQTAQIAARVNMSSINTNNVPRDEHLRNADFFEVENYPEMLFQSSEIVRGANGSYKVYGNLTLKGITKPVELNVEYSGVIKDPWGTERSGFTVTGKINRSEWGVTFNSVLETGGVGLSDEVRIFSEIQLVKVAVSVAA